MKHNFNWFLPLSLLVFFCPIVLNAQRIDGQMWSYKKPNTSNGPCIDNIETLALSSLTSCFGCSDEAEETCQSNCQDHIDSIYRACDGVTLPRYYYYDPPVCHLVYHYYLNISLHVIVLFRAFIFLPTIFSHFAGKQNIRIF